MPYEPDYSKYSLDELKQAATQVDRQKYPQRAANLDKEINLRDELSIESQKYPEPPAGEETGIVSQPAPPRPAEITFIFRGVAREYFRIWIVNLCLTIITLGIFSAWAKVRKKRYFYSHAFLDGTPFQYLAQPIPILKGRVIAVIGFLLYYLASTFFTSLLPYVLVAGLIAAPWVIVRSAAFNARYSAFRNMTFKFTGRYIDAVKVIYAWGIIPALVIAMIFSKQERAQLIVLGLIFFIFSLYFPWWIRGLKKFIIEYTSYGGRAGLFFASGGQFLKMYFTSGLIGLALMIPAAVVAGLVLTSLKESKAVFYVAIALIYVGYVVAYAYLQARSGNLVWNNIQLGPLRFKSTLKTFDLLKLYITNALGILSSVGLLIPWAVIRTLKYRTDNLKALPDGDFAEFQGSDLSNVAAAGAETMDIFDMDISL
ncbi:MAG: DUF898 domain-containing protein [Syntrophaceae bacterium]|nr:DUF898 domain-containing protein [Syntrophaceae bacterium]